MTDQQLQSVPLDHIRVSRTDAQSARRQRFKAEQLAELAESIKKHGVLQPIIVRIIHGETTAGVTVPDQYQLVAGERRYIAAGQAGLERIPAVVRELTDEEVIEVQLIENLQRADVHPMEEAEGYQQLLKVHGHPVEELHARVGKSKSYVYGRLKLLSLCKAARQAFYADEISASVALLIARIPSEKLQQEALKQIIRPQYGGDPMSARRAQEMIHEHFMLRLRGAPFKTSDPDLVKAAGPCNTCPKRTGNQPELFGDVNSADVCTDPPCFKAKVRAAGDNAIAAAKAAGETVLVGAAAKNAIPAEWRVRQGALNGYYLLSAHVWAGAGKQVSVRKLVGKEAEVVLIQDPFTGQAHKAVRRALVDKALNRERKASPSSSSSTSARKDDEARKRNAEIEREFRRELYKQVRPTLGAPDLAAFAEREWDFLDVEQQELIAELHGWDVRAGIKELDELGSKIRELDQAQLSLLFHDLLMVDELSVYAYSIGKADTLLAAAKAAGIDAAALRRKVSAKLRPKKKAKKKASKKRASKKRAGTAQASTGAPV